MKETGEETAFTVDDLPRFSPWPARLLGLEPWEQRYKTPREVHREFELEKWGLLLAQARKAGRRFSLKEADEWAMKDVPDCLCSVEGRLELLSAAEAHQRYVGLIEDTLKSYLPASALVELGAGYGSIILALAQRVPFAQMRVIAGEYTASGVELIRCLAHAQGTPIEVGRCDFTLPDVVHFSIPENAIIFTSYATPYVPKMSAAFPKALAARRPRAVVHVEPCYEHCDGSTLLGLLRRRYIEVNDYNTNLVTLLQELQGQGLIRILEERPAVFGTNPLLVASIVAWASQC